MKLSFTVKSLGKKRPLLDQLLIDIDVLPHSTLQTFLEKIVAQQVAAFNLRKSEDNLIQLFNEETIVENAQSGSVTFNEQYNREKANLEQATKTVLQAFEDGLIAFFINDEQLEYLHDRVQLNEGDRIKLIRLTFLAGRSW